MSKAPRFLFYWSGKGPTWLLVDRRANKTVRFPGRPSDEQLRFSINFLLKSHP